MNVYEIVEIIWAVFPYAIVTFMVFGFALCAGRGVKAEAERWLRH